MPWHFPLFPPVINPNFVHSRPPSPVLDDSRSTATSYYPTSAFIPPPPAPPLPISCPPPWTSYQTSPSPQRCRSPGYVVDITMTQSGFPRQIDWAERPQTPPPPLTPVSRPDTPPEERALMSMAKQQSIADQAKKERDDKERQELTAEAAQIQRALEESRRTAIEEARREQFKRSRQMSATEDAQLLNAIENSRDTAAKELQNRRSLEQSREPVRGRVVAQKPETQPSHDFHTQTTDRELKAALAASNEEASRQSFEDDKDARALQSTIEQSLASIAIDSKRAVPTQGWQGYENAKRKEVFEAEWDGYRRAEFNAGRADPEVMYARGPSIHSDGQDSDDEFVRVNPSIPPGLRHHLEGRNEVQAAGALPENRSVARMFANARETEEENRRGWRPQLEQRRVRENVTRQVSTTIDNRPKRRVRFSSPADTSRLRRASSPAPAYRHWSPGPRERRKYEVQEPTRRRAVSPHVTVRKERVKMDISRGKGFSYVVTKE
ncbi:hypothetical protein EJ05DRAFT_392740 [Pseudovirgaria hyperparasitica]|uniref:Uncharacterized protein n=1 Tax=Pseudovirgaria hyperparasitica TaxID=470096 RepID=A0A6A6W5U5_9PEZI|nr:uncharacterized protein EJ05DRAFT_392740 [Pseudovirgaria hyperparasitica]KAF2757539.1 hypothetical protein EJ05DRAFT_392740 [Pseudovirgaria hyperparasitica]